MAIINIYCKLFASYLKEEKCLVALKSRLRHLMYTKDPELSQEFYLPDSITKLFWCWRTVLHVLVMTASCYLDRATVGFILKDHRFQPHIDFLLQPDSDGNSLLHVVSDSQVLKAILSCLEYQQQEQLVQKINNKQQTVLHNLVRGEKLMRTFLQFCKIKPLPIKYLLQPDNNGDTPLHIHPNNELLLQYLRLKSGRGSLELLLGVLNRGNNHNRKAIYSAIAHLIRSLSRSKHTDDAAAFALSQLWNYVDIGDLPFVDSNLAAGCLQQFSNKATYDVHGMLIPEIAALLIHNIPESQRQQAMCSVDSKKQTLLCHTSFALLPLNISYSLDPNFVPSMESLFGSDLDNSTLSAILYHNFDFALNDCFTRQSAKNIDKTILKGILQVKNGKGRTVFHYAAMYYGGRSGKHEYLWTLADIVDRNVFTDPDFLGNNVIDYLVASKQIGNLGNVIMNILLRSVRQKLLLEKRNHIGLRCTDMVSDLSEDNRALIAIRFGSMCITRAGLPYCIYGVYVPEVPELSDISRRTQTQMQSLFNYALHTFSLTDQSATALTSSSVQQVKFCNIIL